MINREIQLSKEFKKEATKSILAIALFILVYILLVILAVLLTGLCIYAGVALIMWEQNFAILALGIGVSSLGVLVLIFLLKFIFKSHKTNVFGYTELQESEEPQLFGLINELVNEIGTNAPKKVYLSADVTAAVFYDSSFWSMFLPIKKNLVIGLGLVNSVTKQELRAILAHEFGHFSQRTMKVGSYVYNVNQVIYNMLFDNESYDDLVQSWANASGYFTFFVLIAIKLNQGVQWILKKMYELVNISYMALSREMEFHADEIAASVTGYEPLKKSLLRLGLVDNAYNRVLNFYDQKITENVKAKNIYEDQFVLMHHLANNQKLAIRNNLPEISIKELSKFDKSKLVIKNQWASHPTVAERVNRLELTGIKKEVEEMELANSIFTNILELQNKETEKIFQEIKYEGETVLADSTMFLNDIKTQDAENNFSPFYNNYYDIRHPLLKDIQSLAAQESTLTKDDLFADDKVDLVFTYNSMQTDIETLKAISIGSIAIKTFDYDGLRYKKKEVTALVDQLNNQLSLLNDKLKEHDVQIYLYFLNAEKGRQKEPMLTKLYTDFYEFDLTFDLMYNVYLKIVNELNFINVPTPKAQIELNFETIQSLEIELKKNIKDLLVSYKYPSEITTEIKENFQKYLDSEGRYFNGTFYLENNLQVLYAAVNSYSYLLSKSYFLTKKELLNYQESLLY